MAFRFQNFEVYKDIREFIKNIYKLTKRFPQDEIFGLISQLRRAAISIALNLAEGSDRNSDREFKRFVQISIASINEVVAALDIALDSNYLEKSDYDFVLLNAEKIVKRLSALSKRLAVTCERQAAKAQNSCQPLAVSR